MSEIKRFLSTFNYKLIYVFRINDATHRGYFKIGDATIHTEKEPSLLINNCKELNVAAKKRINEYTGTAGIAYDLLYTEIAVRYKDDELKYFRDHDVHEVLLRSGIERHLFNTENKQNEWFATDLETIKNAIKAVKENRSSLYNSEKLNKNNPINFRPEQKDAIKRTISQFRKNNKMLWNAKMRFGKTLCALEVVKEMKFKRTIIFTDRPVVSDGWFEDFGKIFYDTDEYIFGSKNINKGETLEQLEASNKSYVYFASTQDLRGSKEVGGKFDKNQLAFNINWDCVINDEAHEGTQTELGQNVLKGIITPQTKTLYLSGTPFNIQDKFETNETYTWDYVMEQEAKLNWQKNHFGDWNPYEELPRLNIYTYYLDELLNGSNYEDIEDKAFNFKEFFRTWTGDKKIDGQEIPINANIGHFIHEQDVRNFLDILTHKDNSNNYPYSTEEFRNYFRHSLWMVPGVKEAKALSKLLHQHAVFGSGAFNIVNVAGDGDEEQDYDDALKAVKQAIGNNPEETYSITLSCGRLTTGVSVPEWTAVFMLSGSYSTSAASYMQTIFRVQTPANICGKIKGECYVFDFAPDRTLKMVAESVRVSAVAGKTNGTDRQIMNKFLNFCPVISYDGSSMKTYNVDGMLQQLKRAYTERVVKNGFDDRHIYNDNLLNLDNIEIEDFQNLKKIVGASKQTTKVEDIPINDQGLTNEEHEKLEKAEKKKKSELTEEDKELLERHKAKIKQRETAISILRGISIRIPLLVYGAEIDADEDITIDKFTDLIKDELSWNEFMPKGVTKELFRQFAKYYDPDIFVSAGRRIREITKVADTLEPTERVKKIAELFSTFKNPDKETVLTPWRVVNMHMSDCIGGYDFFDNKHEQILEEPRFVDRGEVTLDTLINTDARILEINSKTGLYPLYVAYSIYRAKCSKYDTKDLNNELKNKLWKETIENNIFVICKTPMAKSITKRTLVGYKPEKVNAHCFDDLINQITNKPNNFIKKVSDGKNYWKANEDNNMKFNAIVGNPPYQVMDGGSKASAKPVYNYFVDIAKLISPNYISMIIPAKWYNGGRGLDEFRTSMLNDKEIKLLVDYSDSNDCFGGVDIAGGICYFLWKKDYNGLCKVINVNNGNICKTDRKLNKYKTFIRSSEAISIIEKVTASKGLFLDHYVSSQKPFGLRTYVKPIINGNIILRYSGGKGSFNRSDIHAGTNWIDKWKVIISYLTYDHAGRADKDGRKRIISTIEILTPQEVCTETYIVVDAFDTKNKAQNLFYYLKTKFVRFLIAQLTSTQHLSKANFALVPIQDFSKSWTDEELYKKYNLSEDEIKFIESMIKPMN
jgi:hypothetical protein